MGGFFSRSKASRCACDKVPICSGLEHSTYSEQSEEQQLLLHCLSRAIVAQSSFISSSDLVSLRHIRKQQRSLLTEECRHKEIAIFRALRAYLLCTMVFTLTYAVAMIIFTVVGT